MLFKRASEPRARAHEFCTELDGRIVVTALEGTQCQAFAGRIKQEQRDIVESNYVGQQGGEAVENCIDCRLRSDGGRNL